jgi:hypothetical protein
LAEERNLFAPHPLQISGRLCSPGLKVFPMKIRAGYEISYDCPQSTPMILTLSIRPSRIADLLTLGSHAARPAHPG